MRVQCYGNARVEAKTGGIQLVLERAIANSKVVRGIFRCRLGERGYCRGVNSHRISTRGKNGLELGTCECRNSTTRIHVTQLAESHACQRNDANYRLLSSVAPSFKAVKEE